MNIKEKGLEGELALNEWLNKNGLSYLYIDQSINSFSSLFSNNLKRPDFLVLLESIGMIAVDVKNYQMSRGVYTLSMEAEFQKALTFERVFRLPLWYAYRGDIEGQEVWYWISALKAIEVGELRTNSKTGDKFIAMRIEHFEIISTNQDLAKLYTHRLPSIESIPKVPVEITSSDVIFHDSYEAADNKPSFDDVYSFSYSYDSTRIDSVLSRLTMDVEFNIDYQRGEDRFFSTKEGKVSSDIVALIDCLSTQLLYKLDCFEEPLTVYALNDIQEYGFVIDHLIYAVSSVFFDDKSGAWYEVYIDDSKLTPKGLELVNKLRADNYSVDVGMYEDYALFANIA